MLEIDAKNFNFEIFESALDLHEIIEYDFNHH